MTFVDGAGFGPCNQPHARALTMGGKGRTQHYQRWHHMGLLVAITLHNWKKYMNQALEFKNPYMTSVVRLLLSFSIIKFRYGLQHFTDENKDTLMRHQNCQPKIFSFTTTGQPWNALLCLLNSFLTLQYPTSLQGKRASQIFGKKYWKIGLHYASNSWKCSCTCYPNAPVQVFDQTPTSCTHEIDWFDWGEREAALGSMKSLATRTQSMVLSVCRVVSLLYIFDKSPQGTMTYQERKLARKVGLWTIFV